MEAASPTANFSQHYLQVQALTAIPEQNAHEDITSQISPQNIFFPILIFTSILIIGFLAFLASNLKQKHYLGNTLKLAFVLALIPLGLGVLDFKTQLSSKAGPDEQPTEVTVLQVDSSSFKLTFSTSSPTQSAARLSPNPSMNPIVLTKSNLSQPPSTTHSYIFSNLQPGTTYYLEIYSNGLWYNHNGKPLSVQTNP